MEVRVPGNFKTQVGAPPWPHGEVAQAGRWSPGARRGRWKSSFGHLVRTLPSVSPGLVIGRQGEVVNQDSVSLFVRLSFVPGRGIAIVCCMLMQADSYFSLCRCAAAIRAVIVRLSLFLGNSIMVMDVMRAARKPTGERSAKKSGWNLTPKC